MNFSRILLGLLCLILSSLCSPAFSTSSTVIAVENHTPPVKPAKKKKKQVRKFCFFCMNNEPPAKWKSSIGWLVGAGAVSTSLGGFGISIGLIAILPYASLGALLLLLLGLLFFGGGLFLIISQHHRWKRLKVKFEQLKDVKIRVAIVIVGVLLSFIIGFGLLMYVFSKGLLLYLGLTFMLILLTFVAFQFMFSR